MFTVLIPAFNRPELLRSALRSVSQQTAKELIGRVIVSENGLNHASAAVCAEFPALPVQYVFQETQLPVLQHLKWLLSQVGEGFAAMLCDDDWWDINHIELAKKALSKHPKSVAYFSNYKLAHSTRSMTGTENYWAKAMHYGNDNFVNYDTSIYELKDVLLLCLLFTPFHFSSMVARGDVLQKAAYIFDEIHPTYADRLLFPPIARQGTIIYNPLTTAIILTHPGQDSHTYDSDKWRQERQNGSFKVLELAADYGFDLRTYLNDVYRASKPAEAQFLQQELAANYHELEKLSWFSNYVEIITSRDAQIQTQKKYEARQKSLKGKVVKLARKFLA